MAMEAAGTSSQEMKYSHVVAFFGNKYLGCTLSSSTVDRKLSSVSFGLFLTVFLPSNSITIKYVNATIFPYLIL